MVNIINVIFVCVHVFPVIYICTLWILCNFLCLPYYFSHLGLNIEKQSHTFQLSVFIYLFIYFFYTLGSALVKCGETEKKIGQAGRELKAKSMTNFLHQLKTFLEGDMKTIAVSTLTFYICTVAGADLGGGCRGCTPPLPKMTCGFLIQLVFCQKRNYVVYWCWSRAGDECNPS